MDDLQAAELGVINHCGEVNHQLSGRGGRSGEIGVPCSSLLSYARWSLGIGPCALARTMPG
jgi:hypothetical protein